MSRSAAHGARRDRRGHAGRGLAGAVAGVLLAHLLVGCGPAYRGEPIYGPLRTDDPEVLHGERVFDRACHQCHPGGAAGLGLGINDKPLPGWAIRLQVREGFGAMPAFDRQRLSESDLDAVVAYLLELRRLDPTGAGRTGR